MELSSFKAIDNDMAWGEMTYNDVQYCGSRKNGKVMKGFRQELPSLTDTKGNILLPAVDEEFMNKVLALEPEFIDYLLMGILTKDERNAAKSRLASVKQILRKIKSDHKDRIMKTPKDWEKFREKYEDPETEIGSHHYLQDMFRKKKQL